MSKREKLYPAAKAKAQAKADETGFDQGLEWNSLFHEYSSFTLPQKKNRQGHELRCEVVSCTNLEKMQVGHGYR